MAAVARHLFPLVKPRIVLLLVFTAAAGMWKAAAGSPEPAVLLAVVLAGAVAAAGANMINQGLEPDIDAKMRRTRERAVASRQVGANAAIIAGLVLVAIAVVALAITTNLLAALLTLAAACLTDPSNFRISHAPKPLQYNALGIVRKATRDRNPMTPCREPK